MSWVLIAVISYLLVALQTVLDKFMLSSKRVSHPAIYAFYSGILSLFTLALAPFGLKSIGFGNFLLYTFFGIVFIYGVLLVFFAIKNSEASRVTPVVGAVIPIITYLIEVFLFGKSFGSWEIWGIVILICGGLLISFEFPLKAKEKKFFAGFYYSIFAGILLAIAFSAFDFFYKKEGSFLNVFIWTRMGLVIGALTLFLYPAWKKIILNSLLNFKKPKKENVRTGNLFVLNKILGGVGSALTNYAIALGSVTIVNALVSVEYVFIFIIGIIFSIMFPEFFEEKRGGRHIFQKVSSIAIIGIGVFLISLNIK